jgi:hypothetical protein
LRWLAYVACHGAMFKGVNRSIGGAVESASGATNASGPARRPHRAADEGSR